MLVNLTSKKELQKIDPDYVLTTGVPATKVMFRGKAKINQFHGEFIAHPDKRYIGMPTFHPNYTSRDPSKLPGFQNDIRRLAQKIHGEEPETELRWNIVRRGNLEQFLREFTEAPEFAFDLETAGLFPYDRKGYISAVGIALPTRAWVIPGHMHPDFAEFGVGPWRRGNALPLLLQTLVKIQKTNKEEMLCLEWKV